MKKSLIITIVIIVVLALGGAAVWYVSQSDDPRDTTETAATTTPSPTPSPESSPQTSEDTPAPASGRYVEYIEDEAASTEGTKLLFFHAPWCPQCRALDSDIKATALPAGVTIFKVDYDSNQTLRQKYGVTIQTTVVKVDDNGNLVEKYVAYDEPTFESVSARLLE